ncbi:MAG: UDP-N-acetylglucosamine 1-carboxyvinyltransferase [Deltaproteobacteria bacterium]|nr:UDP-N-acetylglucosamine 1-carboxyvinyltransferase [Deltaproteobacteria bacterium]
MDKIVIWGPNRLEGQVSISGAKNAALPILASTLLTSGWNEISNVPRLKDIETILSLLSHLGVQVDRKSDLLRLNSDSVRCLDAPYDLVNTMRASVLVLGPLVARFKKAKVSLPGGCAIGERPINLHLDALEKLGAKITLDKGYVIAEAQELKGTKICFDTCTVTGTENIMMAAVLARGVTILEKSAKEPEVIDLANALNKMGAFISGAGTDTIIIEGVRELKGTSYAVMQDRIEAGTLLLAAAATGGKVEIQNCDSIHLDVVIEKLLSSGVKISTTKNSIFVESDGTIQKMHVQTQSYPGFPTDLQAQMMVLMTQAQGASLMTENIFENRFNHVAELRRMGAHIMIDGRSAMIEGAKTLSGAPVMATDLRASACLVIAGLLAQGKTEISRVYHLDRGYEHLDQKLKKLGARIERMAS